MVERELVTCVSADRTAQLVARLDVTDVRTAQTVARLDVTDVRTAQLVPLVELTLARTAQLVERELLTAASTAQLVPRLLVVWESTAQLVERELVTCVNPPPPGAQTVTIAAYQSAAIMVAVKLIVPPLPAADAPAMSFAAAVPPRFWFSLVV